MLVTVTPNWGYVSLQHWNFWITEEPGGVPSFSYGAMLQNTPGPDVIVVPAGRPLTLHLVSAGNMHGIDVQLNTFPGAGGLTTLSWIDAFHVY